MAAELPSAIACKWVLHRKSGRVCWLLYDASTAELFELHRAAASVTEFDVHVTRSDAKAGKKGDTCSAVVRWESEVDAEVVRAKLNALARFPDASKNAVADSGTAATSNCHSEAGYSGAGAVGAAESGGVGDATGGVGRRAFTDIPPPPDVSRRQRDFWRFAGEQVGRSNDFLRWIDPPEALWVAMSAATRGRHALDRFAERFDHDLVELQRCLESLDHSRREWRVAETLRVEVRAGSSIFEFSACCRYLLRFHSLGGIGRHDTGGFTSPHPEHPPDLNAAATGLQDGTAVRHHARYNESPPDSLIREFTTAVAAGSCTCSYKSGVKAITSGVCMVFSPSGDKIITMWPVHFERWRDSPSGDVAFQRMLRTFEGGMRAAERLKRKDRC